MISYSYTPPVATKLPALHWSLERVPLDPSERPPFLYQCVGFHHPLRGASPALKLHNPLLIADQKAGLVRFKLGPKKPPGKRKFLPAALRWHDCLSQVDERNTKTSKLVIPLSKDPWCKSVAPWSRSLTWIFLRSCAKKMLEIHFQKGRLVRDQTQKMGVALFTFQVSQARNGDQSR